MVGLEPGAPGGGIPREDLLTVVQSTHPGAREPLGVFGLDGLGRDQVGDRVEDLVGAERVALDLGRVADAGEDEDRVQARFDAGDDIGVHAVADHAGVLGVGADAVHRRAEHHRVGLADDIGLFAGRLGDQRGERPCRRDDPVRRRAGRVGVGDDEPGPRVDEADRLRDGLERVLPGLADDDVVRLRLGHDVARLMQRGGQARLADDERRAAGQLRPEEVRRRERGGPDALLGHVETRQLQPCAQVARREDRVVRQHQERCAGVSPLGEQLGRSRDRTVLMDEHAVHVSQPALDVGARPHVASLSGPAGT